MEVLSSTTSHTNPYVAMCGARTFEKDTPRRVIPHTQYSHLVSGPHLLIDHVFHPLHYNLLDSGIQWNYGLCEHSPQAIGGFMEALAAFKAFNKQVTILEPYSNRQRRREALKVHNRREREGEKKRETKRRGVKIGEL